MNILFDETDQMETKFKLLFKDDRVVEIETDVLAYFTTLYNMMMDCDEMDLCISGIPITVESVTPEIMRALIDVYKIYASQKDKDMGNAWREATKGTPFVIMLEEEEEAMFQLMEAANYLDLEALLLYLSETFDKRVRAWPMKKLEARYAALMPKRKREEEVTQTWRLQYTYEYYVHAILQSMMPIDWVRGVDERIIKYVNPVTCADKIKIVIQDRRASYRRISFTYKDIVDKNNTLSSLMKGSDKLKALDQINEVVAMNSSFAILTMSGNLLLYGEIVLTDEPSRKDNLSQVLVETPLPNEEVLAVWGGDTMILALSRKGLHYWGTMKKHHYNMYKSGFVPGVEPDDVLQVAVGEHQVLILCREGLRVWGYLYPNKFVYVSPHKIIRIKNEVTGLEEKIERIYASGNHTVVLAKSGILYYPMGAEETNWRKVIGLLPPLLPSNHIVIFNEYLSFIVDNEEWQYNLDDSRLSRKISLLSLDGEIVSYTACANYTLIGTTLGLYMSPYHAIGPEEVAQFDGSSSSTSPYKLNVPFKINAPEENKRRRLDLSCAKCSANALFMDTKEKALFCSAYCFRKQKV